MIPVALFMSCLLSICHGPFYVTSLDSPVHTFDFQPALKAGKARRTRSQMTRLLAALTGRSLILVMASSRNTAEAEICSL